MKNISRREFLNCCLRWGIIAAVFGRRPIFAFAGAEESKKEKADKPSTAGKDLKRKYPDLGVVHGQNVYGMVKEAVDIVGGITRFVKKGDTVILKPNFSFARSPSVGVTTSPEVVEEVIKLCFQTGAAKVLVADHPFGNALNCARISGIEEVTRKFNGASFLLGDRKFLYRKCGVPGGKQLKEVMVLKGAMKADVLINLPTAKSHSATGVSLGMKNLMGLIWDRGYFHTRINLDRGIADLAGLIRPQLTVMDLTRALTTGGPGGPGKVEKTDRVIAGVDPVAVDSFTVSAVRWYGRAFHGKQVKHVLAASKSGLGEIDVSRLNIIEKSV